MWGETKLAFWRPRMTQQLWGTGELTGGSGNSIKVNERDKNHFGTEQNWPIFGEKNQKWKCFVSKQKQNLERKQTNR